MTDDGRVKMIMGKMMREKKGQMSFIEHLAELRQRLIYSLVATFAGMILAYSVYDPWLLDLIKGPLDALAGRVQNPFVLDTALQNVLGGLCAESERLHLDLHFVGPMEGFMVKLKASFFVGLVLASPFVFYQVWQFVACGLRDVERKIFRIFMPISLFLFLCGLLIAYFLMMPFVLYFLVIDASVGLIPMLIISKHLSLVVAFCIGFGLIFEMPLVVFFLSRFGLVSPDWLVHNRKYAIFVMFIVAAVLTPPDVVTQVMMGIPMMVLYEISIILSRVAWQKRKADNPI